MRGIARPDLLKEFGTKIILRLGVDPVRLPPGVLKRAITVDRISPASGEIPLGGDTGDRLG